MPAAQNKVPLMMTLAIITWWVCESKAHVMFVVRKATITAIMMIRLHFRWYSYSFGLSWALALNKTWMEQNKTSFQHGCEEVQLHIKTQQHESQVLIN